MNQSLTDQRFRRFLATGERVLTVALISLPAAFCTLVVPQAMDPDFIGGVSYGYSTVKLGFAMLFWMLPLLLCDSPKSRVRYSLWIACFQTVFIGLMLSLEVISWDWYRVGHDKIVTNFLAVMFIVWIPNITARFIHNKGLWAATSVPLIIGWAALVCEITY